MIDEGQVGQVARAVANGDGDWAEVPRCVREAVVLALAGRQSQAGQVVDVSVAPPAAAPLSEEALQRSVRTFDDAARLRDDGVRAFALFHNNVEATREALRHHLRSLWRTAAQLDPALLRSVREGRRLGAADEIPANVPIDGEAARRLSHVEAIIDEVADAVDGLRWASVRFAANVLTDEEKRAMGLNPWDLPPDDLTTGSTPKRGTSCMFTSGLRSGNGVGSGSGQRAPFDLHQNAGERECTPGKGSAPSKPMDEDSMLSEMQNRYMNRIALLNEQSLHHVADDIMEQRRASVSGNFGESNHRTSLQSLLSSLNSER